MSDLDYETVAADLARRDTLDEGREDSPLAQADDALVLDTSGLSDRRGRGVDSSPPWRRRPPDDQDREPVRQLPTPRCLVPLPSTASCAAIVWVLAKLLFRLEVHGRENVPATGAFILAPGAHRSNIEIFVVCLHHPPPPALHGQGLALEERRVGLVLVVARAASPINRDSADREALTTCARAARPRGRPW